MGTYWRRWIFRTVAIASGVNDGSLVEFNVLGRYIWPALEFGPENGTVMEDGERRRGKAKPMEFAANGYVQQHTSDAGRCGIIEIFNLIVLFVVVA